MKTKNTEETRKVTGSARRKLDLQKDLGDDEDSEGNSISDEVQFKIVISSSSNV